MIVTDQQLADSYKNLSDSIDACTLKARSLTDENAKLRSLVLEMGRVIRRLDEDNEHLELWTQDGDYILDGRFSE